MALVRKGLDLGITYFDVGDYWDHDESNEEKFRAIIRDLGLKRDEFRVGLKIFTNAHTSREDLLKESLQRLGLDYADYVVCSRPSMEETITEAADKMAALVTSGLSQHLALGLWQPQQLRELIPYLQANTLPLPVHLQLQYNICRRTLVEDEAYATLFRETGLRLQAADTLEGGILAGHVSRERFGPEDRAEGRWFAERNLPRDSGKIRPQIREKVPALFAAAKEMGVTPAQLSIAYCLLNPAIFNVLFGATNPAHVEENFAAVALAQTRADEIRAAVADLVVEGAEAPPLFDKAAGIH